MSLARPRSRVSKPRFSVVVVALDAASGLVRTLDSLAPFLARKGEILILDLGSIDGTPHIARSRGCRVIVEPRRFRTRLTRAQTSRINETFMIDGEGPVVQAGDVTVNRERSEAHLSSLARNRWSLVFRAGDAIDVMDIDFLDHLARTARAPFRSFEVRVSTAQGWHVDVRESAQERRRSQGGDPLATAIGRDRLFISEQSQSRGQHHDATATLALSALERTHPPRARHLLARRLIDLGFHRSAQRLFLSLDQDLSSPSLRSASLVQAARCAEALGALPDEVEGLLFRASQRDPARREPWMCLATRRFTAGAMQAAVSFASAALVIPPKASAFELEANLGAAPRALLRSALLRLAARGESPPQHEEERLSLRPVRPSGRAGLMRRPAFSVVTIVLNESVRLPHLLESLALFRSRGGEVVVLDTGSDDGTVGIARDAGCVVARAPRRFNRVLSAAQAARINQTFSKGDDGLLVQPGDRVFHIAEARNAADALARHPFIFGVDASDVVDAMDLAFIDDKVRSGSAAILPFQTRRLHRNRWVLEQRDYFHDRRRTRWFGRAHNQVVPIDPGRPPKVAHFSRDRLRVTHHTDAAKARGYQLTGLALDVIEAPHLPHRRLLFGHELSNRGYHQSAKALFRALDHPGVPGFIRSAALAMDAHCSAALGASHEEITDELFKAAGYDPEHRHALLQLARYFLGMSEFQSAASVAAAALAIPARVTFTEPEEDLRAGPHAILYWALFWLGRVDEAREHFKICLAADPENTLYREHARLFGS